MTSALARSCGAGTLGALIQLTRCVRAACPTSTRLILSWPPSQIPTSLERGTPTLGARWDDLQSMTCPFCDVAESDRVIETELLVGFFDRFPVCPGHLLLVTRRHVETWFDATKDEQAALIASIDDAVEVIESHLGRRPDGYNVGFNSGQAAGQTVMHLHLHVIPRFNGDVEDPRGGIRGAIPHKRIYEADVSL